MVFSRLTFSTADALRAAQLQIRQTYPDPHDWAAFSIVGDPGLAVIRPSTPPVWVIASGLMSFVLVSATAVWVVRRRAAQMCSIRVINPGNPPVESAQEVADALIRAADYARQVAFQKIANRVAV